MINDVLQDLCAYLRTISPSPKIQLDYLPGREVVPNHAIDHIAVTLISISEDVSAKLPYVYNQGADQTYTKQNPPVFLELCIMCSAFYQNYEEGLKAISKVIQKLSEHRYNKTDQYRYSVALFNLTMEQNSNLWQALSTNVLPNVVYKIRCVEVIPEIDLDVEKSPETSEVIVISGRS